MPMTLNVESKNTNPKCRVSMNSLDISRRRKMISIILMNTQMVVIRAWKRRIKITMMIKIKIDKIKTRGIFSRMMKMILIISWS